ncbi:MAG: cbb3-type cytochrome oxidase subunit 3 [Bacteroidota bacterium]
MYKYVLRSIDGISIFPIIGLVLFFGFFIGLLVYVLRKDRSHWDQLAEMPLHDDEPIQELKKGQS